MLSFCYGETFPKGMVALMLTLSKTLLLDPRQQTTSLVVYKHKILPNKADHLRYMVTRCRISGCVFRGRTHQSPKKKTKTRKHMFQRHGLDRFWNPCCAVSVSTQGTCPILKSPCYEAFTLCPTLEMG